MLLLLLLLLLRLLYLMIPQLTIAKVLCICHALSVVLLDLIWVFAVTWRSHWTDLLMSSFCHILHRSRTIACPSPSLHSSSTRCLRFLLMDQSPRPLSFCTWLPVPKKPFHFPWTSIAGWGTNIQALCGPEISLASPKNLSGRPTVCSFQSLFLLPRHLSKQSICWFGCLTGLFIPWGQESPL